MDRHESESEKIFKIGAFFEFLLIFKDFKAKKNDVPKKKVKIEDTFFLKNTILIRKMR